MRRFVRKIRTFNVDEIDTWSLSFGVLLDDNVVGANDVVLLIAGRPCK